MQTTVASGAGTWPAHGRGGSGTTMGSSNIASRLSRFWAFEGLTYEDLQRLGGFVEEQTVTAGSELFQQGQAPAFFYLVERGEVLERGWEPSGVEILRRRCESGDHLGHHALLAGTPEPATATVVRDARLLAIKADSFRTVLAMFPVLRDRLGRVALVSRLMAVPLFGAFSLQQLQHVADLAQIVQYPPGETVFAQGDPANAFYVIDTGQIVENAAGIVPGTQTWPKYLTAGSFFGRYGLLHRTPRRSTATAQTEVRLVRFAADAFHWLRQLQPQFDRALRRPDMLQPLRQSQVFERLTEEELKHLAGFVGLVHYRPGDLLFRQGELDPTFYLLLSGEAIIRVRGEQGRERPSGYLRAGDGYGQDSLSTRVPRDATVESTTATDWAYLCQQDLEQYLLERPQVRSKLVAGDKAALKQSEKRFAWMGADEEFVLRERRHWFFLLTRLVVPAVALLGSVLLLFAPFIALLGVAGLVIVGLWAGWRFLDWWNDYYVVTNRRVAHREKTFLVREQRDETPLDKIQNLNTDQGFLGNLFGFGVLLIDTAAASGVTRVIFTYLSNPEQVKGVVFDQIARLRDGERLATRQSIRERLDARVGPTLHSSVPKPVIPTPAPEPQPVVPSQGSPVRAAFRKRGFWIEEKTPDRITWRKHWIRLLARIWVPSLTLLVGLGAAVVSTVFAGKVLFLLVGPLALLMLAAAGWVIWGCIDWANDLYIVTQDKIIDIEQRPLGFRSKRTETTFDRVQNVSFDIPNPLATLLNYGTVIIHTAGAQGRLDFLYVSDPKKVQAEVFHRLATYQASQRRRQREEQWAELPEWFAAYEERAQRRP